MAIIININHETEDLSQYTSSVTDSGDLSVSTDAALAGSSHGLQALIDDTTSIYGEYNLTTSNTSGRLRFRFYYDPNSVTIPNYGNFSICRALNLSSSAFVSVMAGREVTPYIWLAIWNDSAVFSKAGGYISDAPHYIEVDYIRATGESTNDGSAQMWVDGVSFATISNIDNYTIFANFDSIRLGPESPPATTSGTIYLDELVVKDDGSEIGQVSIPAYGTKVGSFNIDTSKTVNQTQSITGLGFQPKIVFFFWSGGSTTGDELTGGAYSNGFGAGISSTSRFCVATSALDAAATSANITIGNSGYCIGVINSVPDNHDGIMDFFSMDADGFSLQVDKQFTKAYRISYLALGGTDLTNVFIGTKQMPTSTGNYNVTGVGFQPDALITCYGFKAGDGLWDPHASMFLGMATSASNQGVVSYQARTTQATSDTYGYGYNGEIIETGNPWYSQELREAFVSFGADGFTANHLEWTDSGCYYYYICLKGGQYKVHELTTRTDGNDIVESDVGFQPKAILFASANRALSTQQTLTAHSRISIGAGTSGSERACVAISDEDNLADTETARSNYDTGVYSHIVDDASAGLMDIKSIDINGFTSVMDTADTSECWVTYLAMGAKSVLSTIQSQTSSNISLTYHNVLTIQDATQTQSSNTEIAETFIDGYGGNVQTYFDTYLDANAATTNYGTDDNLYFRQNGTGAGRNTLLKFDLSSIPSSATCTNAILTLDFWATSGEYTYTFYEILSANSGWTESGATWNTKDGSNNWAGGNTGCWTSGTDRSATPIASRTIPDVTDYQDNYYDFDLDIGLVKGWFGVANYGIVGNCDNNFMNNTVRSSDISVGDNRPKLVVEYTIPTPLLTLTYHNVLAIQNATQTQTVNFYSFTDGYGGDVDTAYDGWINQFSPDTVYTNYNYLSTSPDAGYRRFSFLKFNVSSLEGATVTNAILTLYNFSTYTNNRSNNIHAILVANSGWLEGMTWNYADGVGASDRWAGDTGNDGGTDAGCSVSGTDYNATAMGTLNYIANDDVGTPSTAILDIPSIQAWVNGNNYGIILVTVNELWWCSSDHTTTTYRPKLVVQYTLPLTLTYNSGTATLTVNNSNQSQTSSEEVSSITNDYILRKQYIGFFGMPLDYFPYKAFENLNLTYYSEEAGLSISNATQSQTSDNVILIRNYILFVNNATHAQTVDGNILTFTEIEDIVLIVHYSLTINNSTQSQTSDNVNLNQHYILSVNNATQLQTSDNVILTQHYILIVNNCVQTQTSTNVDLTQHQYGMLVINNAVQTQTSDNIVLSQNYILSVQNTVQAQTSDSINLIQHYILTINNSTQLQTSDNVTVSYFGIVLTINHETGDWEEYTSHSVDNAITSDAALGGTNYGLLLTLSTPGYSYKILPSQITTSQLRYRFYLDVNSMVMNNDSEFGIYYNIYDWSPLTMRDTIHISKINGNYQIYINIVGYGLTNQCIISDKPHWIEVLEISNGANSSVKLWIDDVLGIDISGSFNFDKFESTSWGMDGAPAGGSGTFYLDELVVNNSGEYIGPLPCLIIHDTASQSQTGDNIVLTQNYNLAINNCVQTQTSNNVDLTQHQYNILVVNSVTQSQTGDNVVLTQHHVLTIQNVIQSQTSDNITLVFHEPAGTLGVNNSNQSQSSDNVALIQHQILFINSVSQSQTSDNVNLTQHYVLFVNNVSQIQTSNNVNLTQHYVLFVNSATQAQISGTVVLTQHHILAINNCSQIQSSTTPVLVQHYALTVNNASQIQTVTSVALTQHHVLSINVCTQTQTSDKTNLTQHYVLSTNGCVQTQTVSSVILTQHQVLGINSATQAQSSDNIVLIQHHVLSINSATQQQFVSSVTLIEHMVGALIIQYPVQEQSSDAVNLTQHHVLSINGCIQTQTVNNINLGQVQTITVNNASQIITSLEYVTVASDYILTKKYIGYYGMPALYFPLEASSHLTLIYHSPVYALSIQNSSQTQTSDSINLKQNYVLSVQNITQQQTTSGIDLIQHQYGTAIPNNGTQGQTSDKVTLTQHHIISVNGTTQAQTTSLINLFAHYAIVTQNAVQTQTSSNVNLTAYYNAIPANAIHTQTTSGIALTQHHVLAINNAVQAQTTSSITLASAGILGMSGVIQTQTTSNIVLSQHYISVVQGAVQTQTTSGITLTQHHVLSTKNAVQAQTTSNIALTQHHILQVSNATQIQTSGNIDLIQHFYGALIVSYVIQSQTATSVGLIQHQKLEMQNAVQQQTTSPLGLSGKFTLTVQNAVQQQTSNKVSLFAHYIIIVQNATQVQASTNVSLIQHYVLIINSCVQTQTTDSINLFAYYTLSLVNNSTQYQTSDKITTIQNYLLSIRNATQAQTSGSVSLIQHHILGINSSTQEQTTSTIWLTQHHILNIRNATQEQTSTRIVLVFIPAYGFVWTVERTYFIDHEDREYIVNYESRDLYIVFEDRDYNIERDIRKIIMNIEDRDFDIEAR